MKKLLLVLGVACSVNAMAENSNLQNKSEVYNSDGIIVGFGSGALEKYINSTASWQELHDDKLYENEDVTTMMPTSDGFVVGFGSGAVEKYSSSTSSWKELRNGRSSEITTMMPTSDGFVVGFGSGAVEKYINSTSSWQKLHDNELGDSGFNTNVSTMIPTSDGFAVGFYNGVVEKYINSTSSWQKLHDDGWNANLNTMIPTSDGFVVGFDNGMVEKYINSTASWKELHDDGWKAGVQTMIPTSDGFIVGLYNGAVEKYINSTASWQELHHKWNDGLLTMMPTSDGFVVGFYYGVVEKYINSTSSWKELHDNGWGASVTTMIPTSDGFVVGLNNGAVEKYINSTSSWKELQNDRGKDSVSSMISYHYTFPKGDYFKYCSNLTYQDGVLNAECWHDKFNTTSNLKTSSILIGQNQECQPDSIISVRPWGDNGGQGAGTLYCRNDLDKSLPNGDYFSVCKDISFKNGVISATCKHDPDNQNSDDWPTKLDYRANCTSDSLVSVRKWGDNNGNGAGTLYCLVPKSVSVVKNTGASKALAPISRTAILPWSSKSNSPSMLQKLKAFSNKWLHN